MRRALLLAAVLAMAAVTRADAYVAPGATPVSVSLERLEQADDTTLSADVSTNGRFVAFETAARNLFADDDPDPEGKYRRGGVFRRDLESGSLVLVAHGSLVDEASNQVEVRGAANPSVSGDGRYVVFSTGEQLSPLDLNDDIDVYVRDMTLGGEATGAYDLVSARDGGDVPATYAPRPPEEDFPGRNAAAEVTRGVAISDDGRRVVFRTLFASDLPAAAGTTTPAFQVLVRDRTEDETRLVTHRREAPTEPVELAADGPSVISADGSTVAWSGQNAGDQTVLLNGEGNDPQLFYYLWQRIADGADAPTRRVTGAADPEDPACAPGASVNGSPSATGPCYGPLSFQESEFGQVSSAPPALSGDGRRVAFVTGVSPRPLAQFPAFDLYVTDMGPGVSRKAGTVELTRDTAGGGTQTNGSIDAVTLSPDGRWAAVATRRTRFLLPALTLVGAERAIAGPRELYLLDLQARTVERVLRTVDAGELDADVEPALSASDGARRIAFTSGSSRLFPGDANERADAFVIRREDEPPAEEAPPPEPLPESEAPVFEIAPEEPEPPRGRLTVFVRRAPRGRIRLLVRAPAAGDLEVAVRGRLPGRDGKPRGESKLLAAADRVVRRRGDLVVTVPVRRDRVAALRRAGKLGGQAQLLFTAAEGSEFERTIAVTFRPPPKAKPKPKRKRRVKRS